MLLGKLHPLGLVYYNHWKVATSMWSLSYVQPTVALKLELERHRLMTNTLDRTVIFRHCQTQAPSVILRYIWPWFLRSRPVSPQIAL